MSKPSHNAILPFPLHYHGRSYASFKDLWSAVEAQSATSAAIVGTRLRARLAAEDVSDELLDDCLLLDTDAYRSRYGTRRTYVATSEGRRDVRELFDSQNGPIEYGNFRTRLKRLEAKGSPIGSIELREAATMNFREWRGKHGGKSGQEFLYEGELCPDAIGEYPSFHAFLREVGRYEDRNTLTQRKKRYWDIDDLLREPISRDGMPGYIYQITNKQSGKSYVGLSVNKPEVRFRQHLATARDGLGSLLHRELLALGEEAFTLDTIEEVHDLGDEAETLAEREVYWIAKLGTLAPEGYNKLKGGQLGRYQGTPVTTPEGEKFRSISEMCRKIGKREDLPPYVVLRCWREDISLPEKARKQSKHPEAGTEPFRQWLGIWKRAELTGAAVDLRWAVYDNWKSDVALLSGEGRLTRKNETMPWGPKNVTRMAHAKIVQRTHGKSVEAFGRRWDVLQHALDEFEIPRNTYGMRLKSGWSVEDALATPLGPTSKKPFTFEGEDFESQQLAATMLAEQYGMNKEQVRDYLRRDVPSKRWPKNGIHQRTGMGIRQTFDIDGIHYVSKKTLCRAFGISPGALDKRLHSGMSIEEALKTPLKDSTVSIFGYDWTSAKAACAAFGAPHSTYRARVEKHGMTSEEAIMMPTTRGYSGYTREAALEICAERALRHTADQKLEEYPAGDADGTACNRLGSAGPEPAA